ncbi:hypothetical protein R84B8_02741 [Treponema sp. R8-4-B8]
MSEYETRLRIEQLFLGIRSEWIREAARLTGDFSSWTRRRDMPLEDILLCTLAKKGLSATMETRHYFQEAEKTEQTVSKQDYLRQRQKLNPAVFKILNLKYLKQFYGGQEAAQWHGYLVMAIDGSRAEIPNSEENRLTYGESINQYGKAAARANLSVTHDVFNRFLLDIEIRHYLSSEVEAAKAHIGALKEITGERPVLIMFDRNYESLEFMDFLEQKGVKYLIRLHKGHYEAEISQMRGDDEEVELGYGKKRLWRLGRKSPERMRELAGQKSKRVRIIKTKFANGEEAAFITNAREGTTAEMLGLYRKRWAVEQKYHTLKNKLKFESVTGKASIYVEQDFWAQTLVFNMVQDLITEAEFRAVKKAKKKRLKYEMRINENIAIGLFKEKFIRLMIEENDSRKDEMFRRLTADMERNIVPIRTLKSAPRKWKYYNKYKCNQKPSF